jgi:hypothetical protein
VTLKLTVELTVFPNRLTVTSKLVGSYVILETDASL